MMLRLVSVLSLLSCSVAKITIDNVEQCEPNADYDVSFTCKINNDNEMQVLEDASANLKIDIDDSVVNTIYVYTYDGEDWNLLLALREKICQIREKYLSAIGAEFEKAAEITESCPYSKGEYKISNFPLDFEKFNYSILPRGKLRLKGILTRVDSEDILACHIIDFTVTN